MDIENFVARAESGEKIITGWGELNWKVTAQSMPGAEMTFGTCFIKAGERNSLHSHPNCEEYLYVASGECEHRLGDDVVLLRSGDVIRIPQNVRHWARAIGASPVLALIVFSSGSRKAVDHEASGA